MARTIWMTWLPGRAGSGSEPESVVRSLREYGFGVEGMPWIDDPAKMAWFELGAGLLEKPGLDAWMVAGNRDDFRSRGNRYALTLITAMLRQGKGPQFPMFCLGLDEAPLPESMPMLLRDYHCLSAKDSGWQARLVSGCVKKTPGSRWDFYLNAVGHPFIGQWFEVGPCDGVWSGAMFGVSSEATITHHMVGPRGQLPEKSVVEYPVQGIQAEVKGVPYTAWAVQNRIDPAASYYVRIEGYPASILFGGHPGADQAEVTVLELI